jgi:hypothetical protein
MPDPIDTAGAPSQAVAGESHDAITVGLVNDAEQAGLVLGLAPDSEQLGQFTRATASVVGKILAHVRENPTAATQSGS